MKQLFSNNAKTTLTTAITATSTSLVVADGSAFPNPGAYEYFLVTLEFAGALEVVMVTGRAGNTLTVGGYLESGAVTVGRAQEGTTASVFAIGTRVECRVTKGTLNKASKGLAAMNYVSSLIAPKDSYNESFVTGTRDPVGTAVVAITKDSGTWSFLSHTSILSLSTTSGTTTSVAATVLSLPSVSGGKYLVQFTSGVLSGYVREIASNSSNSVSWATALPSAPTSGVTFEIYKANTSIISEAASGGVVVSGKLLGRATAGDGAVEQITLGTGLALAGSTLNVTVSGGSGSPAGAGTELQYRSGASFGAMSGTSWDNTNRSLTLSGASVSTDNPIFNLSQTWNAGGITFTGLRLNISDTASASGSMLLDIQKGGISFFNLPKAGGLSVPISGRGYNGWDSDGRSVFVNGASLRYSYSYTNFFEFSGSVALPNITGFGPSGYLRWGATDASGVHDLLIGRDAANTLAQRNATNPQIYNLYNTYSDSSNYERGYFKWSSNALHIGTEASGTGSVRGIVFDTAVNLNEAATSSGLTLGTGKLLGRASAGTGVIEEIILGTNLSLTGNTLNAAGGGGSSPAGTTTEVQYRNGTSLGAMSGTTWDDANRSLSIMGGALTTSNPILNLTQTWNAGAVAFTGLKLNVVPTASAAASLLLDLQISAASVFKIDKTGFMTSVGADHGPGASGSVALRFGNGATTGLYYSSGDLVYQSSSFNQVKLGLNLVTRSDGGHLWSSTTDSTGTVDLGLYRGAAGTLDQRNSTSAQAFRVYNTYTDVSNYERGFLRWTTNEFLLGAEAGGSGTTRRVKVLSPGGLNQLTQVLTVAASDETTVLSTGTSKVTFHVPFNITLTEVFAGLSTPQTSGSTLTVNVKKGGVTIFSTKITIDNTESTSITAAVAPVLSTTALLKGDAITVDIDTIGDGTAKGLKVYLIGLVT